MSTTLRFAYVAVNGEAVYSEPARIAIIIGIDENEVEFETEIEASPRLFSSNGNIVARLNSYGEYDYVPGYEPEE